MRCCGMVWNTPTVGIWIVKEPYSDVWDHQVSLVSLTRFGLIPFLAQAANRKMSTGSISYFLFLLNSPLLG